MSFLYLDMLMIHAEVILDIDTGTAGTTQHLNVHNTTYTYTVMI